jgi:hypothetical protein
MRRDREVLQVLHITFPAALEWSFSEKPPRQAEFSTEPNDCTPDDLQYLIDFRKKLAERTGVDHDERCRAETHVFPRLVNAMRKHGVSVHRDLPANTPV